MTGQVDAADREVAAAPRVLVTRTPARSAELVEGLTSQGFAPVLSPLSEAQAVSGRAGSDAVGLLSGGPYDVVTFTSANGVWAADVLAREHSARSLGELFGHARVWCVGEATRAAAMNLGLTVQNPPRENSAAGMLKEWTRVMGEGPGQSVLCVHGEPARTELVDGLRDRGHRVREATVYEQVPFPASRPLIKTETERASPAPVLGREATSTCLRAEGVDAIDAVVATSPRLIQTLADLGPVRVPVICIGRTTERAARELGLEAIRSPGTSAAHLTDTVSRVLGYDEHRTTHELSRKEVMTVSDTTASGKLDLVRRPRRLRTNPAMRDIIAETRLHAEDLIQVLFVRDGIDQPTEIVSMPGQYQHTIESLVEAVRSAVDAGVKCVDLFGVPRDEDKDSEGSAAWDPEGILNRGIAAVRREFGDQVVIMADTCLDEFTDHGHCGPLTIDGTGETVVDNDRSVHLYERMAVSQARAGAHVVSPSGMMDGQIAGIRQALDEQGFQDVSIMAYSAKYASAFFGPFRDAVGSSLQGDRKTYQQDPANRRESVLETQLDLEEGADMVMVKPAMAYLDVVREVADLSTVPVAVYQVSGEYAMIEAAAANGWVERERIVLEALTGMRRAGADLIFTYYATEVAHWLSQGKR